MFAYPFRAALVGAFVVGLATPSFAACPPDACPHACKGNMRTITYPVADLILPVAGKSQEDKLMQVISSTISPKTWTEQGGEGFQVYHPLTLSLVVQQTTDVHENIQDLLASLRRLMDVQVALEIRFVTMSTETVEALGLEMPQKAGEPALSFLDDTQLLVLMKKVQEDMTANVMQAPKMTAINGQEMNIAVSDDQSFVTGMDIGKVEGRRAILPRVQTLSSGVKLCALPVVSADRRFVKVRLGVEMSSIDTPVPTYPVFCTLGQADVEGGKEKTVVLTQYIQQPHHNVIRIDKSMVIPDGKTAVLTSWKMEREVREEHRLPVLSEIPYINRLFTNVSYSKRTENLLVLVTPRIIINEEQEEKVGTASSVAAASDPEVTPAEEQEAKPAAKEAPADPVATLYVKDKKFQLTYDLDNIGPSQVKGVEVWWTKDAKAWERFADEVKPTGKVVLSVKDEGTYGFKLHPRSGAGLSSPAPKAGDRPHTWVVVDTTAPVIKMEPVKVVETNGGEVVLEWAVTDDHLAVRPVTVRYSEKPEGPWIELVARGAATDTFRYAVSKLPTVAYFRIDATDKSGNIGTAWTAEPVKIDLKVPVIRNVTIKP